MKTMQIRLRGIFLLYIFIYCTHGVQAQCTADAGADTTICDGQSVILGETPSGTGLAPLTYSWTPNIGLSCTNCANPVADPSSTQTYTLTVTDDSSCVATDQVTVTVNPVPSAGFNIAGNNACSNVPFQFTNTSSGTGLSYQWNFGDPGSGSANTSTLVNPIHLFNAIGGASQNFNVSLIVTNANGCAASISQTASVLQIPDPSLFDPLADFRNCDGSNFDMTVYNTTTPGANSNYTIQWGDGSPDYNSATFPGGGVNHVYTTAEIFNMYFIVTGNNGCVDSALYNVANITNPAIGAANPGATTGCGPLNLCFPLSNFASNHSTTFYVVDYGDNSPLDTLPHPPPATICHNYTESSCGESGNQYVFKIKAINLCDSSEASISPIRVYTGPEAGFTPSQTTSCVNTPILFTNTTATGFNSSCNSNTLFQWNFGDGNTLTTATLTHPSHAYANPGTYTVSLTASNTCQTTTVTEEICIEVPPTPLFTISPDSGCIPLTTQITNLSDLANTCNVNRVWSVIFNGSPCMPSSGQFNFSGGTNAGSFEPEIEFLQAGNYTVRLSLTNTCGTFIYELPVVAQTVPQVSINAMPAICVNSSVSPVAIVSSLRIPIPGHFQVPHRRAQRP